MKRLKLFLFFLFVTAVLTLTYAVSHGQDTTAVHEWSPVDLIPASLWKYAGIVVAIYEVIVLIVPTVKNYSIIGKIIAWLGKGGARWK